MKGVSKLRKPTAGRAIISASKLLPVSDSVQFLPGLCAELQMGTHVKRGVHQS